MGVAFFVVKRSSEGSSVKLESVADMDVSAEENCNLPSRAAAEAVPSNERREQTTYSLQLTRR